MMLLTGLDLNRCVERSAVSDSLLDFKQFSFAHATQVLGTKLC
jgi:hypothetical protein